MTKKTTPAGIGHNSVGPVDRARLKLILRRGLAPKVVIVLRQRVESFTDERRIGNGEYLAPGWCVSSGTGEAHCFSETNLRDVRKTMRSIARRECDGCRAWPLASCRAQRLGN